MMAAMRCADRPFGTGCMGCRNLSGCCVGQAKLGPVRRCELLVTHASISDPGQEPAGGADGTLISLMTRARWPGVVLASLRSCCEPLGRGG